MKVSFWKNQAISEIVQTIPEYSIFARRQDYEQVAVMQIDFLMTVEIRIWRHRFADLELYLTAITKAATIERMGEFIIETVQLLLLILHLKQTQDSQLKQH
jgi:hypothetical protein